MPSRRRSTRVVRVGAALVVLAGLTLVSTLAMSGGTPAQAAATNPYQVTFVARQCPEYTDIMANLARNNIQESQQDLGPDSVYQAGQPISPSVEAANDSACTPLEGWQFTFGNGINGQTPGTHLSRVSNPVIPPVTVQPSVPLLDAQGNPTGQTIAAATTVTLTQAQITAALNHQLWVQGGTATDPLGTATFANRYAFGALRCAVDNLNGDNVEWVGLPSGQTNVFCYYYAVDQTPAPGTIVVQKQLAVGEAEANTFQFQGNVSYNPGATPSPDDNPFEITVPASGASPSAPGAITFVRSSGVPWSFTEVANPGWAAPTSPTCLGGAVSIVGAQVTLTLQPGAIVTCTYTDSRPVSTPPTLTVLKQTTGGSGGPFDISVTQPAPATPTVSALQATTAAPDQPVVATLPGGGTFNPDMTAGTYTFSEDLTAADAATGGGTWTLTDFECDGIAGTPVTGQPTTFTMVYPQASLSATTDFECTFTNSFTPDGSLTITKTTTGGVGTTDFVVTPVAVPTDPSQPGDVIDPVLSASTTQAGVAAPATQIAGSPLDPLPLGQYSIVEEGPQSSPLGTWAPVSIACNGASTDPTSSDVLVSITASDPQVTCAFTNGFTPVAPTPSSSTTVAATQATVAAAAGPALASTGTDVRVPLSLALVLALAGSILLVIDRIRRSRRVVPLHLDDEHPD